MQLLMKLLTYLRKNCVGVRWVQKLVAGDNGMNSVLI